MAAFDDDDRVARVHPLPAVRVDLLEMLGDQAAAREAFLTAAGRSTNLELGTTRSARGCTCPIFYAPTNARKRL